MGGQNRRGGFKDFEKLINGGGGQNKRGWGVGTKYKRKETQIGLSLLTLLNIGISSILWSRYTNETSRVCDIFMNFCVPREIQKINKRGSK